MVHLAGESIAGRFTEAHRKAIRDSRIEPTRLAEVAAATSGVRTFVSASAVGFYGHDCGDTVLDEDSPAAGFLADVVAEWEAATGPAADAGRRVVMVRTGIVQAAAGGDLATAGRCSPSDWAGGSAAVANGCPGSVSTTCSISLPRPV